MKFKFDCSNVITIVESMIDNLSYFEDVIKATLTTGHKQNLIITGENATGKSFIRRLVYLVCKQEKVELIHLSQQGRSTSGIPSALIYGDESCDSTDTGAYSWFNRDYSQQAFGTTIIAAWPITSASGRYNDFKRVVE